MLHFHFNWYPNQTKMSGLSAHMMFDKFDGEANFTLFQMRVLDILMQNRVHKTLRGTKANQCEQEEWQDIKAVAFSNIRMSLANFINS